LSREDGFVLRGLVMENPHLCRRIVGKGRVAVEVVLGDVEEDYRMRPEGLYGFELKAAYLGDHVPCLPAAQHVIDQGLSYVAAYKNMAEGLLEDAAEECGGGSLPVRAGNRDNGLLYEARSQLDLAHDPRPVAPRLLEKGVVARDPGTYHDQLVVEEVLPLVSAEPADEGDRLQGLQCLRQGAFTLHIGY